MSGSVTLNPEISGTWLESGRLELLSLSPFLLPLMLEILPIDFWHANL